MAVKYHTISEHEAGQRIDNFLMRHFRQVPKSVIYRIVRKGEVRVDKKRVKPEYKLMVGEQVRIPPVQLEERPPVSEASEGLLEAIEKSVLLEDEQLIVINKPAGLAVHGGSGVAIGLIEAFRQLRPNLPFVELVHRLDKETSGLVLLAKSRPGLNALHDLLRNGGIEKHYHALVAGPWRGGRKHISLDLKRETGRQQKVQVVDPEDGKHSESIFRPEIIYRDASLIDVEILTGRMHQIRVQLAHLGYPILGDSRYGDFKLNRHYRDQGLKRLFLHAGRLDFMLELNGRRYELKAPMPKELKDFLKTLPKGEKR